MKTKSILFALAATVLALSACKRTPTDPPENMADLVAPPEFEYSMTDDLELSAVVQGNKYLGKVQVAYYGLTDGRRDLIVSSTQVVNDTARIVFKAAEIYDRIEGIASFSDGSLSVGTMSLGTPGAVLVMKPINAVALAPVYESSMKTSGPGCNCAVTVTTISGKSLTVAAGAEVCITDGLNGKGITIGDNAEVRICGTFYDVEDIVLGDGAKLILNDNASLTFDNGEELVLGDGASVEIYNGALLELEKELDVANGASVLNYGTITADSHINVFAGSKFTNHNLVGVKGHVEVSGANGVINNHGYLYNTVNDHIQATDFGTINNYCRIFSDQHIWIDEDGVFNNFGQAEADSKLKMDDNGTLNLNEGSIFICEDLQLYDALINGVGPGRAMVHVLDDATYYNGATATGDLDICVGDKNQNSNNATLSGGAAFSCATSIPVSACITIGHNSGLDADFDGVADDIDPFPNDSSRAGTIVRSASSLVFEDNWPYQGDYDFNDLVVDYQLIAITNRIGDVKDIKFAYQVRARGASYDNGFGIEFTIDPANVEGSLHESTNPTTTSVVVLSSISNVLTAWNTDSQMIGQPVVVAWDTLSLTLTVPVSDSVLDSFNPFLYVNQDRTREVHLSNFAPTPLADTDFFGRGDDASNPSGGIYYRTEQNQPWVLNVPINFDYPREKSDITHAYLHFAEWATSGGTAKKDWYVSEKPNYSDLNHLFK